MTLASAVTSTDEVTVSYTVPSDAAAARLKDLADNPAASFAGRAVTNNTAAALTPLTASIHSEPASHDGQAAFTFELRFSENLEGFSYKTLRDHAFTVTGGEVQGTRRLVSGSNIRWEITVRPSSDADVTIVLPITTDCTAPGRSLHRGRQKAVQPAGVDRWRSGAVGPSPEERCRTTKKPAHMNQAEEARSEAMNPAPHPQQRLQTQRRNNHSVTGISRQARNRD